MLILYITLNQTDMKQGVARYPARNQCKVPPSHLRAGLCSQNCSVPEACRNIPFPYLLLFKLHFLWIQVDVATSVLSPPLATVICPRQSHDPPRPITGLLWDFFLPHTVRINSLPSLIQAERHGSLNCIYVIVDFSVFFVFHEFKKTL